MGGAVSGSLGAERHARRCICCTGERLLRSSAILMPFLAKRIFDHDPVEITEEWALRDIPKAVGYSVCSTLECADCGVMFLDYRFSDNELARLYQDYRGDEYNALRTRFEPSYAATAMYYTGRARYLDDVEAVLAPYLPDCPKVLDWGGDAGVNSPFRYKAKALHIYDISGVAVCSEAIRVSQEECRKQQYDLVACSQVLEHVSYPLDLLKQLTFYLGPQTILYLEVPFEEIFHHSEAGRGLGEKKRHWHEHVNFFSPASLRAMARSCSLEVLEAKILPVSLGWRDSAIQMLICRLA
jgi:hypothetical protein